MFRFMTPVLLALVDMQLIGVSVSPWGFMFFWSLRTLPRLVHFIVCSMLSFFVMLIYVSYQRLSCHATITPIITSLPHYIIVSSPHVFFAFFIVVLSIAHLGFIVAFRSLSSLRSFRSLRFLPSLRSLRRCVCYVCCAY